MSTQFHSTNIHLTIHTILEADILKKDYSWVTQVWMYGLKLMISNFMPNVIIPGGGNPFEVVRSWGWNLINGISICLYPPTGPWRSGFSGKRPTTGDPEGSRFNPWKISGEDPLQSFLPEEVHGPEEPVTHPGVLKKELDMTEAS